MKAKGFTFAIIGDHHINPQHVAIVQPNGPGNAKITMSSGSFFTVQLSPATRFVSASHLASAIEEASRE